MRVDTPTAWRDAWMACAARKAAVGFEEMLERNSAVPSPLPELAPLLKMGQNQDISVEQIPYLFTMAKASSRAWLAEALSLTPGLGQGALFAQAMESLDIDFLRRLVDQGADLNAPVDAMGETPLILALKTRDQAAVNILAPRSDAQRVTATGQTALNVACAFQESFSAGLISSLLPPAGTMANGNSPLAIAAMFSASDETHTLVEPFCDLFAEVSGQTALAFFIASGNKKWIERTLNRMTAIDPERAAQASQAAATPGLLALEKEISSLSSRASMSSADKLGHRGQALIAFVSQNTSDRAAILDFLCGRDALSDAQEESLFSLAQSFVDAGGPMIAPQALARAERRELMATVGSATTRAATRAATPETVANAASKSAIRI